jgi:hypothetical protein
VALSKFPNLSVLYKLSYKMRNWIMLYLESLSSTITHESIIIAEYKYVPEAINSADENTSLGPKSGSC